LFERCHPKNDCATALEPASQPASQPAAANDQRRQRQCETSRLLLFSCLCHWRWKASATAAEINRSDTLRNQQSTDQRWRNRVVTDQQPARLCPIHKETTATKRPVHCAVRAQAQGARGQELLPEVQEKRSTDLGPPESRADDKGRSRVLEKAHLPVSCFRIDKMQGPGKWSDRGAPAQSQSSEIFRTHVLHDSGCAECAKNKDNCNKRIGEGCEGHDEKGWKQQQLLCAFKAAVDEVQHACSDTSSRLFVVLCPTPDDIDEMKCL